LTVASLAAYHRLVTDPDLGRLLLEAQRVLASDVGSELDERGFDDLRPGHAAAFLHIDRRRGSRLTDLATRARVTKQAMMLLVDDLESLGYVRRVVDQTDSRAKVVRLTARGRTAAAECRRAVQAVEKQVAGTLGDRRYELLRESLALMTTPDEEA
jgi:DNA-binding MarR family transcriptional regulator